VHATAVQHNNPDFNGVSLRYDENGPPVIDGIGGSPTTSPEGVQTATDETATEGWPATPFAPNVASPIVPAGSVFTNHTEIVDVSAGGGGLDKTSIPFGAGQGTSLSPHASSKILGTQIHISSFHMMIPGESGAA
jgi:hypothetical protein